MKVTHCSGRESKKGSSGATSSLSDVRGGRPVKVTTEKNWQWEKIEKRHPCRGKMGKDH